MLPLGQIQPEDSGRNTGWLAILLVLFVLCALSYSVVAPLWEASDESEHFQYVVYLATQHQLPSGLPSIQPSGNNEGNQPPLYYVLVQPLVAGLDLSDAGRIRLNPHMGWVNDPAGVQATAHFLDEQWPYHGAFLAAHRLRALSTLLGALTLLITYFAAKRATGDRRLALAATAILAILPGYLFSSATINNDVLANVVGALLLLVTLWRPKSLAWRGLAFGAVAALGVLTKLDLLPLIALGGLVLCWDAMRTRTPWPVVLAALPVLPAAGFWLWRVAHGDKNLIGDRVVWPPPLPGTTGPLDWGFPVHFVIDILVSFIGAFGRQNVLMPIWLYLVYGVALFVPFIVALLAARPASELLAFVDHRGLLIAWLALPFLGIAGRYFLISGVSTGYDSSRFIYPALPAFVIIAAVGAQRLLTRLPHPQAIARAMLAAGTVSAFALPWLVIKPTYPPPFPVTDQVPLGKQAVQGGTFAHTVTLAAMDPVTSAVPAGQAVRLTFYWQVQQPLPVGMWLFVHVINAQGQTATAFDGPPLFNTLPVDYWRTGDVVIDAEVLTVHGNAAPGLYQIKVGWYDPKSGQRLALSSGGTELDAGTMDIAPPQK